MPSENLEKLGRPVRTFFYAGPSMRPIFRNGDLLEIEGNDSPLRKGDVIIFRKETARPVIHRIVSMGDDGIKTCGDNNAEIDPWTLRMDEVIGRVVAVKRATRRRPVSGGYAGHCLGRLLHLKSSFRNNLLRFNRPVYRSMAKRVSKAAHRLGYAPRIYRFERPEGLELRWVFAGWTIGLLRPGADGWQIRPPFRLLFDGGSTPCSLPES